MSETHLSPRELRGLVLRAIGVAAIVGGTLIFPRFPIVVMTIIKLVQEFKGEKIPPKKIKRVLKNLEKKEIIFIEDDGEEAKVHIKDKNNRSILKYSLKSLLDFKRKSKKWKGKWFMVFFDIPEKQRNKRDYLRRFLLQLGFCPYQKSVYLFPYECKKEIELIKKIVEGGKYIKYIIAEEIEDQLVAKIFFKL